MSKQDININYHSFLNEITTVFDPILKNARNQDASEWKKKAWLGPLNSLKGLIRAAGPLGRIGWATLPIVGPGVVATGGWLANLPIWLILSGTITGVFLVYWLLVFLYSGKMSSMGRPEFHIGAFKAKRPLEYQLWAPFFREHHATFEGLYGFVTLYLNPNSGASVEAIIEYTKGQVDAANSTTEEYRTDRDFLKSEVDRYVHAVGYLVGLVKVINKSLYRLVNDVMDYSELNFVCAYTIYEVDGDVIRLKHDQGTTGRSPRVITLTNENADKYAAVFVAMQPPEDDSFSYNNPFPGRTIASYRMNMLHGEKWIWNFHFDDSDERALKLALSNDIIEIREVYRLVHVFSLILQKREIEGREGFGDGQTSKTAD